MKPLFLATRAVSSEFIRRIYLPLVLISGVIILALLMLTGWLTTVNEWWWLLLVPLIIFTVLFIFAASLIGFAIKMLRPFQTKAQKKDVSNLVDKLQEVSEGLQLPKFLLIYQLVKDTFRPSGKGFIRKMTSNAVNLKPDFERIIASFK